MDTLTLAGVFRNDRGLLTAGCLKLSSKKMIFKNSKTGKVNNFNISDLISISWQRLDAGIGICVLMTDNRSFISGEMKKSDYDKLSEFISSGYPDVELSLEGCIWGSIEPDGDSLYPDLSDISDSLMPLKTVTELENDATVESHQNDDAVNQVDMRFQLSNSSTSNSDDSEHVDEETPGSLLNETVSVFPECQESSFTIKRVFLYAVLPLLLYCFIHYYINISLKSKQSGSTIDYNQVIEKKLEHVKDMPYKDKLTITSAVDSMSSEVAVLLLLGESKDTKCKKFSDTAYCFGRELVNTLNALGETGANQEYAFIDGSLKGYKQVNESMHLALVDKTYPSILIYNIESMSADAALAFMQIDPDVKVFRQHLVVLMAYIDTVRFHEDNAYKLAEEYLESKWNSSLSDDKLHAILSRITGNVVKL